MQLPLGLLVLFVNMVCGVDGELCPRVVTESDGGGCDGY